MTTFRKATKIKVDAQQLGRWHRSPGAFARLVPPWERMRVIDEPEEIADGARAVIKMKSGPFWMKWVAEHEDCHSDLGFTDVQVKGPFVSWSHVHSFHPAGEDASELEDKISYRLPLGFLGHAFGGWLVRKKLERTFRYRHSVTKMDLERASLEEFPDSGPMTVLITGATGMVGSALEAFLRMRGHRVRRVTRYPQRPDDVRWDPSAGELDLQADEGIDAVVHLAGENIAGGRWSDGRKRRIIESRRLGTRLLCEKLVALERRPHVLVSVSGVNFYASGTATPQDESSERGSGFLSDVCDVWEGETAPAEAAGIRVARLRLGIVLSPAGGALAKMLPAFKLGIAGRLGSGTQRMPWIALDDVIDIMHRSIRDPRYTGAINVVAPGRITNAEFTSGLASTLHRPAIIPMPAFVLKLALGKQMADETLLVDLDVAPAKLESLAYPFRFPEIGGTLAHLLGRS